MDKEQARAARDDSGRVTDFPAFLAQIRAGVSARKPRFQVLCRALCLAAGPSLRGKLRGFPPLNSLRWARAASTVRERRSGRCSCSLTTQEKQLLPRQSAVPTKRAASPRLQQRCQARPPLVKEEKHSLCLIGPGQSSALPAAALPGVALAAALRACQQRVSRLIWLA